jgi:transposase
MSARIMPRPPRSVRRRLKRRRQRCSDSLFSRRIRIVELYADGWGTPAIAEALGCAPATAVRVLHRFRDLEEDGLEDGRRENGRERKVDDDLLQALSELLSASPEDFAWARPTWTQELLAEQLARETGTRVSETTLCRMLKRLGARWGTARPVVACWWPRDKRERRLRYIRSVLGSLESDEAAYYEDEVDIHLNPRIGRDWMLPGTQRLVLTPGRNKKRYLAGALAADGSELIVVESERKTSELFLAMLVELRRRNPQARRIHLVLDNYVIHSSRIVQIHLAHAGSCFRLHFLPPYCPNENRIERVWRELHANVTRNHRCTTMPELMSRVRGYLRDEDRRRRAARAVASSRITQGHLDGDELYLDAVRILHEECMVIRATVRERIAIIVETRDSLLEAMLS